VVASKRRRASERERGRGKEKGTEMSERHRNRAQREISPEKKKLCMSGSVSFYLCHSLGLPHGDRVVWWLLIERRVSLFFGFG
jgi:hypothetical protein